MKHRLHVVSLPHTQTTKEFSACAYTEKVRKFCRMMYDEGHIVHLYAGEKNEAPCHEHISCISEPERKLAVAGLNHYTDASFDSNAPHWIRFNERVISQLQKNLQPHDIICLIGGVAQKPIADAFSGHMSVEFGIGYAGHFARYKVWESYAWMHCNYGNQNAANRNDLSADWTDAVIPGYVEAERFPYRAKKDDYCLYVGRCTARKGIDLAFRVASVANKRLIVVGPGDYVPAGADYRGPMGTDAVAKLMSKASVLLAPTFYIEPFGNVAVEAMMCGTPVITTDWGAFTETNIQGVTGFRCRTFAEFVKAVDDAKTLDTAMIRRLAKQRFSLEAVAPQYTRYFDRLAQQWNPDGWWHIEKPARARVKVKA